MGLAAAGLLPDRLSRRERATLSMAANRIPTEVSATGIGLVLQIAGVLIAQTSPVVFIQGFELLSTPHPLDILFAGVPGRLPAALLVCPRAKFLTPFFFIGLRPVA